MEFKISKELFEAVMGYKVTDRYKVIKYKIDAYINRVFVGMFINDFFFKCKEWAYKLGYEIESSQSGNIIIWNKKDLLDYGNIVSDLVSEQQAVFDACQWILDNEVSDGV